MSDTAEKAQQANEPVVFSYPSAAQLLPVFDVERLRDDLRRISTQRWDLQRNYTTTGPGSYAAFDWRALPLRSPAGRAERTDPGGAGIDGHADTDWLAKAPYMAQILATIPAPLRSVRLLALAPGAVSKVHFETKIGFPWGNLRLHVPIITNPGATLMIDGIIHQWQPGTFWFGDFCRWHQVANHGAEPRVHMIIDTTLTPGLIEMFPANFRAALSPADVLFNRPEAPAGDLERYRCSFEVPMSYTDWEEPSGLFLQPQDQTMAAVRPDDGRLVLDIGTRPQFGLVHTGDGEFRFSGWTDERTVQIVPLRCGHRVFLRARQGSRTHELEVPAVAGPS